MTQSDSTVLVTRLWLVLTKSWLDSKKVLMPLTRLWLEWFVTLTRQKWLGHITG